jgi:hypothetical protein
MLFSNTDVRYNFNFTFNGNNIPMAMSHKHLGVTLSSDAKWNNHIENERGASLQYHLYKLKIAKSLKLFLGGLQQRLHKQLMMLPC